MPGGQERLDDDALDSGGARHRAADQGDVPAAGQVHLDGGPLGGGDQLGGLLLEDHLVAPVQPARGELAELPVAGRHTAPGVEVRLQQAALPRRALLQQPLFDDAGRPADHGAEGGVRLFGEITEAQDALDEPVERVPDGYRRARVGLGAFGEVLGAVDADQPPLREGQPDAVGPAELLGEHEAGGALDRGQPSGHGRVAETAVQHRPAPVGEAYVHLPAREHGLQPIHDRTGRPDEAAVQVEVLDIGELAAVRGEPQRPAALPRAQDRAAHGALDRPAAKESVTREHGADVVRHEPHPDHFPRRSSSVLVGAYGHGHLYVLYVEAAALLFHFRTSRT
ncbi:hypothetical protein J3S04_26600 [Streptomyces griseocarneus]|uniref:Uncharacterized protein n=1 Tax=Streptomyces griseocarneus TaxID=51201 RepID=A0ABX7RKB9_9ACTN|nr:hypothetical protein J3S04_26600 [Streptomyces griseocarneus]